MPNLNDTIKRIQMQSGEWRDKARTRLEQLTMPHWAMGRLMDLAEDLAGMTRSMDPPVRSKTIVVMAGDHGVVEDGVSKFPQEVTPQMVYNIAHEGAGINAMAKNAGAKIVLVDIGVAAILDYLVAEGRLINKRIAPGTRNMANGPAMTREQAIRSIEAGIDIVYKNAIDTDLYATGEMGIGNTTPSAAITSVLTGRDLDEVTGRGTGLDNAQLDHKVNVLRRALDENDPNPKDGLDVLAKVGGFEIGGMAGVILGSASMHKPVVIDGFISGAAALIAQSLCPDSTEYMIASHMSVEPGHAIVLEKLGKQPLLQLDLRLGEGTGAALAMPLVDAAVRLLTDVKTFSEAGVGEADK